MARATHNQTSECSDPYRNMHAIAARIERVATRKGPLRWARPPARGAISTMGSDSNCPMVAAPHKKPM